MKQVADERVLESSAGSARRSGPTTCAGCEYGPEEVVSSTRWRAVSQLPLGQPRVGTGQGVWDGHQVGAAARLLEALLGVEDGVVAAAFVQRGPGR